VNPIGPRSMYDEAKRFAEAACAAYARSRGVDVRIARIFNTYGPRMQLGDGRAIPNFLVSALRGDPLTIYGDGTQTRSFCYVDDLVDGLYRLLVIDRSDISGSNYGVPVFNLGNPEEITVSELARQVLKLTGSKSSLVNRTLPGDDPKVRRPDIRKAQSILGWVPTVSRREGLKLTIAHFLQELGISEVAEQS